jgi:dTDP-4-dehydrorhamnose 3,5-epimerase
MNFQKTDIDGVVLIEPRVFQDHRGSFYESWKKSHYLTLGMDYAFLQDNVSTSKKNVLRGMHYQKNQGQIVTLLRGEILDVVVDLRKNSKTFKKFMMFHLSDKKIQQVFMPPGCAHGFYAKSDDVVMNYKCTQEYNTLDEIHLRWNDPEINIPWPLLPFEISEKDQNGLLLNDILQKI